MKMKYCKKMLALLLALALSLSVCGAMAEGTAATNVVSIKGFTKVCTAYHQLVAIAVEYDQNVQAPAADAYTVTDYATKYFREAFNNRPFSEAPVTCVYTNDAPEQREDKTSVEGKYVIIELAVIQGTVEEDGIFKPAYNAGVCTWRLTTEAGTDRADWRRKDFSDLVITQNVDVKNAAGEVVSKAGTLPTLQYDELTNYDLDDFVSDFYTLSSGNQLYYSYYLPENYDSSKAYPLVVSITGGGGTYREQANGDPRGGHISRDAGAVAWLHAPEDVLVLSPQQCGDPFKSTGDDIMEVVNYFIANYAVDTNRVYAIGSSAGGLTWSSILSVPEYAAEFAAYAPCNTNWTGFTTMFKSDYDVKCTEDVWGFSSYEDFMNPDLWLDDSEWVESAKALLAPIMENRVNVYVWHAYNDETAPVGRGISTYYALHRFYAEQGLSEEEIDSLVKIYLIPTQEDHDLGILSGHMASKVAVAHPEFIEWMLAQTKGE